MASAPRRLAPLALLALAAACATPRLSPRPAHGVFDPSRAGQTATDAIGALQARGFELAFRDTQRGLILTRTREGQATCGVNECLTRDTYVVRLENGRATAVLTREIFDSALRSWERPRDAADLDGVESDEVALLKAFLAEPPSLRPSQEGEPCAGTENCGSGLTCEGRRCRVPGASSPAGRVPAPGSKR